MSTGPIDPARLPPVGLHGMDPAWSRLVPVELDGTRTFHVLDTFAAKAPVRELGATFTVLCVHGNPSWSFLWRELLAGLPEDVRGIAVDHLDMGFSERTGRTRRLADRIDDLSALTAALELTGPVITIAHDWGGPISLGWAQRHLDQLRGVVLCNTAVHQPEGAQAPAVIRAARTRTALRRATVDTTAFINGALQMSRPKLSPEVRHGFLAPYETSARREAIGAFVQDIPLEYDHPSSSTLDRIAADCANLANTPALLLWGSSDLVFSDLYLHDLEARLPHADVHRWAAAGHFVTEDADVAGAALDWIETVRSTEPTTDQSIASDTDSFAPTTLLSAVYSNALADTPAIVEMVGGGSEISFGELAAHIDETAGALLAAGVNPGERVALMIPPGIEMVSVLFAIWRIGAAAVLVDGALKPKQMTAALTSSNPAWLVGIPKAMAAARALRWPGFRISTEKPNGLQRRLLDMASDLPSLRRRARDVSTLLPPLASDEAAVVFTSGSTGPSKGVRYSHERLAMQRDLLRALYDIDHQDSLVAAFAPFALYGPLLGITSTVPDMDVSQPGSIDAARLAEAVNAVDATMVFASPAALGKLAQTQDEIDPSLRPALDAVQTVISAGAPVRASLLEKTKTIFPNAEAYTPYGMTEVLPVASISLSELIDAGRGNGVCVGHLAPGVEVAIDPIDSTNPNFGEIRVRAAHQRLGYDRLWHTTHQASQPDGWHRTGDVGELDDAGRLWVSGRLRHVLWTEHGPLGPVALEKAVEDLPGVRIAAVVGVGPTGQHQPVVVIESVDRANNETTNKGALASIELIDAVRAIAPQVVAVLEVEKLPVDRRHNSKIDRTAVREWAENLLAGGSTATLAKEP